MTGSDTPLGGGDPTDPLSVTREGENRGSDREDASAGAVDRRALLRGIAVGAVATSLAGCNTSSLPVVGCGQGGGDVRRVSGEVSGTWGSNCGTVVVSGETFVPDGATLTVEPGTEVVFEEGAALGIAESADFVADGDSDARIYFRGDEKTPGFWGGIVKHGPRNGGGGGGRFVLNNATVEYAGGNQVLQAVGGGGGYVGAALVFKGATELTVTETRVEECSGYGLYLPDVEVSVRQFGGNRITNCAKVARASEVTAHVLGDAGNYRGNDEDLIEVFTSPTREMEMDGTWNASGADYRVRDDLTVTGHLTVGRDKTLRFLEQARLTVTQGGALTADGGQVDATRITFTGDAGNSRPWWGIRFEGSTSQDNQLRNVVVEGAGVEGETPEPIASVVLAGGAAASVAGSVVRDGLDYGIRVDRDARLRSFDDNVVTGHAAPAWVRERSAAELAPTTSYAGNEDDRVHVEAQSIDSGESLAWSALDVPYFVRRQSFGDRTVIRGRLTVDPGAVVEFAEDRGFAVEGDGVLRAVGEEGARVHFRGSEPTPGHWRGLEFVGTGDEDNRLESVTVEHGGANTNPPYGPGEFYQPANVLTRDGGYVDLVDVVARNAAGYGVSLWSPFEGDFTRNALTGNEMGPAFVHAPVVDALDPTSTYAGNGRDRVVVRGRKITGGATWNALDADYELRRHPQTEKTPVLGQLTVERGTTVNFDDMAGFRVVEGGTLTAIGTPGREIVLKGAPDNSDGWLGVVASGSSKVTIRHARISGTFLKDPTEVDPRTAAVLGAINGSKMFAERVTIDSQLPRGDGYDVYLDCTVQTLISPQGDVATNTCDAFSLAHTPHPGSCPMQSESSFFHNDLRDDPVEDDGD